MDRKKCPSCGAAYNGRRCRNCYYERFAEEISHGLHTHEGEPLVIKGPVRKPLPRRNPLECDRKTRKKPRWLKTVVVWILVLNLLPLGIEWIQEGIDRARVPEPVFSPMAQKLWEGEDLAIWTEPGDDPLAIPILVENRTRDDVYVIAGEVFLGNYQTEETVLYIDAYRNSWGRGYLFLDGDEVAAAESFEEITFNLEIYDDDSYDIVAMADSITIS